MGKSNSPKGSSSMKVRSNDAKIRNTIVKAKKQQFEGKN
jgi:hypothetical protein